MKQHTSRSGRVVTAMLVLGMGLASGAGIAQQEPYGGNTPYVGGRPVVSLGGHGPDQVDEVVWKDSSYNFVVLVPAEQEADTPFAHPVSLTPEQLTEALERLEVRFGEGKPARVFPPAAVERLVQPLSAALGQVGPQQEVMVQTVARDPALGILIGPTVTNARVFANEGYLQFVFGEVRGEFSDTFRATGILRSFAQPTRHSDRQTDWTLVGDELTIAGMDGDAAHAAISPTAWSHVAVPAAQAEAEPRPGPGLGAPAAAATATAASTSPPAAQTTPTTQPVPAAPAPSPAPTSAPGPVGMPDRSDEFAQRLRTLESLHEQGLITDQEYQAKRKQILDEL